MSIEYLDDDDSTVSEEYDYISSSSSGSLGSCDNLVNSNDTNNNNTPDNTVDNTPDNGDNVPDNADNSGDQCQPTSKVQNWVCPVCSESERHPFIIVKCGHSYCDSCLARLSSCPQCRVSYDRFDLLPNYALAPENASSANINLRLSIDQQITSLTTKRQRLVDHRIKSLIRFVLDAIEFKIGRELYLDRVYLTLREVKLGELVEIKRHFQQHGYEIGIGEVLGMHPGLDCFILTIKLPDVFKAPSDAELNSGPGPRYFSSGQAADNAP